MRASSESDRPRHGALIAAVHRPRWRSTPLWLIAPTVSIASTLPVLRHAATLDTYRYPFGHDGPRVRAHAGLFLIDGLLLVLPSLVAAAVSQRYRTLALTAVAVVITLSAICEAFVSVATW
jgi:hypothetical protein